MVEYHIRPIKWNSGVIRWSAYRKGHVSVRRCTPQGWGLYAEGFESLEHLMDWLFCKAPGRTWEYRAWQRLKPEYR
jgi:hypothetical protein